ncbi:AAA family ATPase [Mycobacterium paraense]|uniref:AAA family ATPase n=1 Tax=Mycobacterium paraense TaxID=767916 RepID=UPI0019D40446|nr:ATP-binding protein [Mycobacterium paraense]
MASQPVTVDLGFTNPYRPGAGHMPPHLAGREREYAVFDRLLAQDPVLENLILTGLRGVGKTVLLETFKPRAVAAGWHWVGTDLSQSASVSEENLAIRVMTDLAAVTSAMSVKTAAPPSVGYGQPQGAGTADIPLSFGVLRQIYENSPGLVADKLKSLLTFVAAQMKDQYGNSRVVFAYDEAQNLSDNKAREQYPLSTLLDVFQYLQREQIPFMLVLTGLPTMFSKLVEARTYSERMFRVVTLGRLDREDAKEAVTKPLDTAACPIRFRDETVEDICDRSGGYPYFIQFICREVFDVWISQMTMGKDPVVHIDAIQARLDSDFFAGRWEKATDRQRDLLWVIAHVNDPDGEFSISEIVEKGRELLDKPFSSSHASQMLSGLIERGLVHKNRFGKYSFAVPLLAGFIIRTHEASKGEFSIREFVDERDDVDG